MHMTKKLTPALKGLITALLMMAVTFLLYNQYAANEPAFTALGYSPYLVYAAGIIWTLVAYRRSEAFSGKFRDLFNQGFRCFIIVTLLMTAFWIIFLRAQPQYKEEAATVFREQLMKEKSTFPKDIDEQVERFKKQYNTGFISASIFGYLLLGALVTAGTAALLTRRNQ